MIADPEAILRATALATQICELSLTRGRQTWVHGWLFRHIGLPSCLALLRVPNTVDPGDLPGLLPNFLKVWRFDEEVLQMDWQSPPDVRIRVHIFQRGAWEAELLAERMHSAARSNPGAPH